MPVLPITYTDPHRIPNYIEEVVYGTIPSNEWGITCYTPNRKERRKKELENRKKIRIIRRQK